MEVLRAHPEFSEGLTREVRALLDSSITADYFNGKMTPLQYNSDIQLLWSPTYRYRTPTHPASSVP